MCPGHRWVKGKPEGILYQYSHQHITERHLHVLLNRQCLGLVYYIVRGLPSLMTMSLFYLQMCSKHGTDFLEYKCRYCCSVAVFFCFGTTHFCNACHDDFQRMTSVPKEELPHCPAGNSYHHITSPGFQCGTSHLRITRMHTHTTSFSPWFFINHLMLFIRQSCWKLMKWQKY